jgi:hypothetical protein
MPTNNAITRAVPAKSPPDETQKSDPPRYAVLAVRDRRSMFGPAEAWVRAAGRIIRYETFEAANAAAAALNEAVEVELVSYKVVQIDVTQGGR